MQALLAFGLVFLFPAFTYQLAFDQNTLTFTGSPFLQFVNASCEIYALVLILSSRQATDIVLQCRPILVLGGMAFASTAWAYTPAQTLRAGNVFLTTTMFGLAMATRLPQGECLQLVIRTMALGCVLSVIWVFAFPGEAVHQSADRIQSVHAGLWRGIFSHKQGLGVFAGLTLGLLLFYGSIVFSSVIFRFGAIGCAFACLMGTGSTTGYLTAAVTTGMLYATYAVACSPQVARKAQFTFLIAGILVLFACFHFGALDFLIRLAGKSTDLTGRTDIWPLVMTVFASSGPVYFGGGFATTWAIDVFPDVSVDNGYLDKIIEFGYAGSAVVFAVFGWIILRGRRMILVTNAQRAAADVFPFCIMFVLLFINITESNFMYKHIATVLIAIIVAFIVQASPVRSARKAGAAEKASMRRRTRGVPAE